MPKSRTTKKVTLEGRTRLPQRVQDLVIELGSAMTSIQQASGSTDTLVTSIRNFAVVDGIMANSAQNLEKLDKQLERMEAQSVGVEQGLTNVACAVKTFEAIEQSGYCTSPAKTKDENLKNSN